MLLCKHCPLSYRSHAAHIPHTVRRHRPVCSARPCRLVHDLALQLADQLAIVRIAARPAAVLQVARERPASRCARIAAARHQAALAARLRNAVRDARRRDGVHEGALTVAWNDACASIRMQ